MPPLPASTARLPLVAALFALAGFVALQLGAAGIAGWVFEYPLDDVYIHLAMAESLTEGSYGINAGEPASAASSILYPILLMPFPGTEVQRLIPLALNLIAVTLAGGLWGLAVARSGLQGVAALLLAALGPLALNMPGVAFTGMEHSLHTVAALATVLGIWTFLREDRIGALLILGTIFAPLLRLEGLALSGLACLVILLSGRVRAALLLGAVTLAPVLAFAGFLTSLGLAPVPGSVIAKISFAAPEVSFVERIQFMLHRNTSTPAGLLLALVSGFCLVAPLSPALRENKRGWMLVVLGVAGLAHLIGGQIGWLHRYEHYILVAQLAGLVLVAGQERIPQSRGAHLLVAMALAFATWSYWPTLLVHYVWNPRAVHLQQAQMGRFAKDWVKAPVVVNDLGWVGWRNPDYVLDIYGLGSPVALAERLREGAAPQGWADGLAAEAGADLAMIYDSWFDRAVGEDWIRLGDLTMDHPRGALGDWTVTFYATDPEAAERLRELMADFAQTLPADAHLSILPATDGGAS